MCEKHRPGVVVLLSPEPVTRGERTKTENARKLREKHLAQRSLKKKKQLFFARERDLWRGGGKGTSFEF